MTNFDLKAAINIANQIVYIHAKRNLTDIERIVMEGAWERLDYDQIAAQNQYATSYISQDVAPKLWKLLSDALDEKVKKSNFKSALHRYWETHNQLESAGMAQPNQNRQKLVTLPSGQLYVDRPPIEQICCETLMQPGALIRIKAPQLMGKTRLMEYVMTQLQTQDYRTINLSFELADRRTHLTDLDRFLRWFCVNLSHELNLPNQLDEYWDEAGMGSKVSCTTYVEEYLLAQSEQPLVLCLDDVDLLFPHPEVYEDFFGLLRSWYEKARSRPIWQRLRLMISHATNVYIQLNINQSPFNVGLPVELPEFTLEQTQAFAALYELNSFTIPENQAQLTQLTQMIGGHPYLLEQALAHLKAHPETDLTAFLADAPTDAGIFSNHLREHWLVLQSHPEVAETLQAIVNATEPIALEPVKSHLLQGMGLITLVGNRVKPRCALYQQYFQAGLGGANDDAQID
ncbi:AAA-like domain-containing protein [filamentous cyanobacterium LEGE 11480]|uniref:AAA-like domain-containing protein n=2 Tax=Romeriopsis TaxID=2992131 RepID=A0A928VLW4_9CYAN|nr:AAA-like domain-containing protein [Romeriopsis navalis LEGE 11480]